MEEQLYLDSNFGRSLKLSILLITNRDSDNVGDQVIEACDIALIKTVMSNLGFNDSEYEINSRALSIISNRYCETEDPRSLKSAYRAVGECSLVLFGGAPVFNYLYKNFYKKTTALLKIAKELNKPVLFSAIGINDAFNEKDSRCQLLKNALHNDSVIQITTRDGIEHLRAYAAKDNSKSFPIDLVSDPAVYAKQVFNNLIKKESRESKKIGLFVFRAGGFVDNGIPFSRTQQAALWCDLCRRLKKKGYDYELLTSGHFADEAFLKYLIDEGFVQKEKCIQSVNTPEELVGYINSYDAVVTARLHPSIISFSCEVPAVGLIWNSKVKDFYDQIGYSSRAVSTNRLFQDNYVSSEALLDELEKAMQEGVVQDKGYLWSVYRTLYSGFVEAFELKGKSAELYSEEEVETCINRYPGTSAEERDEKITRKLARCYRKYNDVQIKHGSGDIEISLVFYHSGGSPAKADAGIFQGASSEVIELPSGNLEYRYCEAMNNNGEGVFAPCGFFREGKTFLGWRLRFRVNRKWFWYSRRGKALSKESKGAARRAKIFKPGQKIPLLPYRHVDSLVIEAVWK